MARGADLTKVLDPAEVARLRTMLAENPVIAPEPGAIVEYPRMLYHSSYVAASLSWRTDTNELVKRTAAEKMRLATHEVIDVDEEEDFLLDGWKHSPADFMAIDPRIPAGREARRASFYDAKNRETEIRELRLRLAELTGTPVPVATPDPADYAQAVGSLVGSAALSPKRSHKKQRRSLPRRPSQVAAARQAVETTEVTSTSPP